MSRISKSFPRLKLFNDFPLIFILLQIRPFSLSSTLSSCLAISFSFSHLLFFVFRAEGFLARLILPFSYPTFSSASPPCVFLVSIFPESRWIFIGPLRLWPWCLRKPSYCRFGPPYKKLVPIPVSIWPNFSWKRWRWLLSGQFAQRRASGQCNEWIEPKSPVLQFFGKHGYQ